MLRPAIVLLAALPALAQDHEYLRALEAAQKARPAELKASSRIAPATEAGAALVVHGRAFAEDGKTPLVGAIVFAYHTDRTGRYDEKGAPAHSWRLKGWAKTGADGRFEFQTIRPGSYPSGKEPAHIHLTIYTGDGKGFHAGSVLFDDDALVTKAVREKSSKDGLFGEVCRVRRECEVQHVDMAIRPVPAEQFTPAKSQG